MTKSYKKKEKKTTSAATAAGCGTGRRGGSNQEREENNWPEATREREVTWLLSWPRAREGSSRKGWSQSGPRSLLLLVGPSSSPPLLPPTQSYSHPHPHPHPVLLPHTASCQGSLHRNRMISSHLLLNMGHHGSNAKAGPFVSDRGHWYLGERKTSCHGHLEGVNNILDVNAHVLILLFKHKNNWGQATFIVI